MQSITLLSIILVLQIHNLEPFWSFAFGAAIEGQLIVLNYTIVQTGTHINFWHLFPDQSSRLPNFILFFIQLFSPITFSIPFKAACLLTSEALSDPYFTELLIVNSTLHSQLFTYPSLLPMSTRWSPFCSRQTVLHSADSISSYFRNPVS